MNPGEKSHGPRYTTRIIMRKKNGLFSTDFGLRWVKEPRRSETIPNEKGYLCRSTRRPLRYRAAQHDDDDELLHVDHSQYSRRKKRTTTGQGNKKETHAARQRLSEVSFYTVAPPAPPPNFFLQRNHRF